MDRGLSPTVYRTLLVISMIGVLCLAFVLLVARERGEIASDYLFWLEWIILLLVVVGLGGILWYQERRLLRLQKSLELQARALSKSEEKYRSLVESAEDFIFTLDGSGCFKSLNNFTASFFGGTPSQFLGRPLSVLFPKETAARQLGLIAMVFRFGKSLRDEFKVETGEHQIWLSGNFMPIKDEKDQVSAVLCIARDITEHKKLESQLINTEKLASMGTLAAGVAHELNNPLGVILGFTDLLLEKSEEGTQDYEDLRTIERHSLHCKQVVENLLSFARQGEGEAQYCDINEAIDEIIGVVEHSLEMHNIELRKQLYPDLPKVKGDQRQMQQVLLNLVNNAAAAMKGGGVLEIETTPDGSRSKVRVSVADNGHGIKEEDVERIFDPFFTTKSEGEGTGLGLFVSHGIVTKYEGTIRCESSQGEGHGKPSGTVFTVTLRAREKGSGNDE